MGIDFCRKREYIKAQLHCPGNMTLIENIWKDWVANSPSLHFDPVEVAQMGKSSSRWFGRVPEDASEHAEELRSQVCRGCVLYSGSEGDFLHDRNLREIIVDDRQCTGIYLHTDDSIPGRTTWRLQAGAPRGTFSNPDPRAVCAK